MHTLRTRSSSCGNGPIRGMVDAIVVSFHPRDVATTDFSVVALNGVGCDMGVK